MFKKIIDLLELAIIKNKRIMKAIYSQTISQSHMRFRAGSFGRVKRTYRRPQSTIGHFEILSLIK